MYMQNSVIDLIIRIKNSYMTRNEQVEVLFSKFNEEVLKKLLQLGFIKKFETKEKTILVELIYKDKKPAMTEVQLYSKPGRRYYVSYKNLKLVMGGLGYSLISTSQGVLTNKEAREKKVGGELLFSIW
ncbi:30S ribosomal protein S8 [Candidatus Roizmanbacteria bacterium RIFCSPLOWO2_01_FULL_37_12]|uniref:Small ribosomal subunit protein uS8 n=1 Tax=Candidatus Roizmanbacteria bacterium RIFCSPLOWO2_01_FULL_37_12 TaxID=1802056 RepID=A0A1F7IBS8_9BACT|nr:MAG: 30S ribosomal protein S8 [Candidatus Roizmanbacteria bacterium RIFCSPHIGHO2_01_FULL_37_16]OGK25979.1 MAG: 30S ribosomal protein S8 [Candidatus Roizmanbacteria bacterium RIFCSPHIGHO2_02_FULL_37_9b]OGK40814.1 MAG: 30S ribosomal protein S8 [Candidatus Roizmanbacteria bacterium RIFCSPLOWO2_01_FULL_37_12]